MMVHRDGAYPKCSPFHCDRKLGPFKTWLAGVRFSHPRYSHFPCVNLIQLQLRQIQQIVSLILKNAEN